jgi:hypothetical protein
MAAENQDLWPVTILEMPEEWAMANVIASV